MNLDKKIEKLDEKKSQLEDIKEWDNRFEELRKKGMTLKEFSDKYGLKSSYICHIKAGRCNCPDRDFKTVENALAAEGV